MHFIWELNHGQIIDLKYCPTTEQLSTSSSNFLQRASSLIYELCWGCRKLLLCSRLPSLLPSTLFGGFPTRFFHLQSLFCIWVPNMATHSLGPIFLPHTHLSYYDEGVLVHIVYAPCSHQPTTVCFS